MIRYSINKFLSLFVLVNFLAAFILFCGIGVSQIGEIFSATFIPKILIISRPSFFISLIWAVVFFIIGVVLSIFLRPPEFGESNKFWISPNLRTSLIVLTATPFLAFSLIGIIRVEIYFYRDYKIPLMVDLAIVFTLWFCIWLIGLHSAAYFARTEISSRFIKSIDYFYLGVAALAIIIKLMHSIAQKFGVKESIGTLGYLDEDFVAFAFILLAIAARVTRTSVEVFGWFRR